MELMNSLHIEKKSLGLYEECNMRQAVGRRKQTQVRGETAWRTEEMSELHTLGFTLSAIGNHWKVAGRDVI